METVFASEVEVLSLQILKELELEEAEWLHSLYEQLNFIEEKWLYDMDSITKSALHKRMAKG